MIEQLITDLQQRLRQEVPQIETIDENYGQLQMMLQDDADSDTYPIVSPAVLIDIQRVAWSGVARDGQKGEFTIVITLAIDCYDDTHTGQPQTEQIAERMRLCHKVEHALHCYKPTDTTRLIRQDTRYYHLPRLWKAYETTYTCVALDTATEETSF